MNVLKHVFINFIFTKLEFSVWHICLCTRQPLLLLTTWVLEAALSSVGSPIPLATTTNLSRDHYIFRSCHPSFCCSSWMLCVQLRHFHKIINIPNTSISKNHQNYHLV